MANLLTGDYEAVVQIAIRQINGLLGTIHQNADQNTALKLLHSTSARVGDPRPRAPDTSAFADWVTDFQVSAAPGHTINDVRAQLNSTAPPGVAKKLSDEFDAFDRDWVIQLPPDVVRGLVKMQLSSITIAVPDGSSSEITIHAQVRAHYYPDPRTTELPAPVHGEVRAVFDVGRAAHWKRRLEIRPSSQDAKIQFLAAPGSGLTTNDENVLSLHIRKVLRERMSLLPIDLPADFPFADFKGLGVGANPVIALPLQLSDAPPPSNGLPSLTKSFIGAAGFGFAINKQFVVGRVDLEPFRQAIKAVKFTALGAKYRLRFSSGPDLTFTTGGIDISARIEAETGTWYAPNLWVKIKQRITLVVDASGAVHLARIGETDVDASKVILWTVGSGAIAAVVKSSIDKALSGDENPVGDLFDGAKNSLTNGLKKFDPSATASFTVADVTSDGAVVSGEISNAGSRRPPVVSVEQTDQGAAFTAFQSWIPAGRIDRFVWSWIENAGPELWSGVERSVTDEHRFILPKPRSIANINQICLRIEGTQIMPAGHEISVAAGATCQIREPDFGIRVPSWWEPLTIPAWRPNSADAPTLRDAISGHMSVQTGFVPDDQPVRNALVCFVGDSQRYLESLRAALDQTRTGSSLVTTVVVPAGTFDAPRREVESALGLPREDFPTPLLFTEDDEGGWTSTFGVAKTPSMYLLNTRGEFVWKQEGEPDPAALAAALHEHAIPTEPSVFSPLQLALSPGDPAPDVFFEDAGEQYTLHRMLGRTVLLNFWQSWSAPCLSELRRLQELHQAGEDTPFVVAFQGGKRDAIDDVRKRLGISFPLVQDSQQQIARRYGVRCWPTTVMIDAEGHVERAQFGTAHDHGSTPRT
jgi:peroxiredoxin